MTGIREVGHEELVRERFPDGRVILGIGQSREVPDQGADDVIVGPASLDRGRPQDLLRRVGYPLDPGEQECRESRGKWSRLRGSREQFLGVVRVALGTLHYPVKGRGGPETGDGADRYGGKEPAIAAAGNDGSSTAVTVESRSRSATTGRSGWRRCRSSVR